MTKYSFIFIVLCCIMTPANAVGFTQSGRVEYTALNSGNMGTQGNKLLLDYSRQVARLQIDHTGHDLIAEVPIQQEFIDFSQRKVYKQATLIDGISYFTMADIQPLANYKPQGHPEKIMGYSCQKYVGSSFSNTIELWVTTDAGIQGTPISGFTWPGGLILKYQRNGNSGWVATSVKLYKNTRVATDLMPQSLGVEISQVEFSKRLANAFVKEVRVFDKQQLNWGAAINNPKGDCTDSLYRFGGGTIAVKRLKLPDVPDGTNLFVELTEQSNGDAYDRTGSLFIIPSNTPLTFLNGLRNGVDALPQYISKEGKAYQGVVKTENYQPLVELMRFFTPFGVHHFNDKRNVGIQWDDSVIYKQDITELLPLMRGEVWIGVFVGNYDSGGHKVSVNLKYHLNDQEKPKVPNKKTWFEPVFNTTNVLEMGNQEYGTMFRRDTLTVEFEVPQGVKNIRFRYITTGHGGWGGGDEYLPKKNELFIDGKPFFDFTPWRVDCATYRTANPASGNFWNGLSSSDLSRSGWCPGSVSHPYYTDVSGLAPGKHRIQVYIPLGEPDLGMFSAWNISGVFYGEYEDGK